MVSVTFLGEEGLVITGSYHLSHAAVVAAAIGIPLEGVTGPDAMDDLERLLADDGVDPYGDGSLSETELSVDGAVATLSDFGLTSWELMSDFGMTWISRDGLVWEQVDVQAGGFGEQPVTIGGAIIGEDFTHAIGLLEDGVEWNDVVDLATGRPLRGGRFLTAAGTDRALYARGNQVWAITVEGATRLVTEGTEFDKVDRDSVENNAGSMAVGHAGVAYLTGFTGGAPQEPYGPTAIVVSTDYQTWTRFPLPDEMIVPDGEISTRRLSVGAAGLVVWGEGTAAWFGELNAP
jgi:hypothetical protein